MSRAVALEALIAGLRNNSGEPLAAGKIHSYEAGTTTEKDLYTEQDMSVASANPATLDAYGRAKLYADGSYKLVIKDSAGATIQTLDDLLYGLTDSDIKWCGQAEGSANAFTVTTTTGLSAYAAGQFFAFEANHDITASCTLNVDSLGAKTIKDCKGRTLIAKDIVDNDIVVCVYNGTDIMALSLNVNKATTWTPTLGASGSMTYTSTSIDFAKYWLRGSQLNFVARFTGTVGGTPSNTLTITMPFPVVNNAAACYAYVLDNSANVGGFGILNNTSHLVSVRRYDGAAYTAGTVTVYVSGIVEIA